LVASIQVPAHEQQAGLQQIIPVRKATSRNAPDLCNA